MAIKVSELTTEIRRVLLARHKQAAFTQKDVLELIDLARNQLLVTTSTVGSLDAKQLAIVASEAQNNKGQFCKAYQRMTSGLRYGAKKTDTQQPGTVFLQVCKRLVNTLDDLEKKIGKEKMFADKTNIYNLTYGHLVVLGTIDVADAYGKFMQFLTTGVLKEITAPDESIPPYRLAYIHENEQLAINITNWVMDQKGPVAFAQVLTELQKNNNDHQVVTNEGEPNTEFFDASRVTTSASILITRSFTNPFLVMGRMWNIWRNGRIKRLEQEREWMEAHKELLRMKLDGVDPDSEEYRSRIRIIEKYERDIAKTDKKLAEYYDE